MNSEIFLVNVGHDHVGHSLAVPLWGHMADALDGHELQAIILLSVARDLAISKPGSPGFSDGPVKLLDPSLGAVGGDGTISVARVEHKTSLIAKDLVDPL